VKGRRRYPALVTDLLRESGLKIQVSEMKWKIKKANPKRLAF
jgi:hypothetical protein